MARLRTQHGSAQPVAKKGLQTSHKGQVQANEVDEYQVEIGRRAQEPSNNPSLSFDSSMTVEEIRAKFKKLREKARVHAFA